MTITLIAAALALIYAASAACLYYGFRKKFSA